MEKKPLDSSYSRYCLVCDNNRVHRMNTVQLCTDCFQMLRHKGYTIDPDGINKYKEEHPSLTFGTGLEQQVGIIDPDTFREPRGFTEEEIEEMTEDIIPDIRTKVGQHQFPTGAVRGSSELPFHLVHPHAMMGVAMASGEGREKYGAYNNLKGFPLSNLYNHAFAHMLLFWWGDTSEDHLGHALWNLSQMKMQMESGERYEKLDDRPASMDIHDSLHSHMERLKQIITSLQSRSSPQEESNQ